MPEVTLEAIGQLLESKLKPIEEDISEIKKTMHGKEGRTGVAADATKALELAEEHETILRGKDKSSGMIKKINHLWCVAGGAWVAGIFMKAMDYFSNNPTPPHH